MNFEFIKCLTLLIEMCEGYETTTPSKGLTLILIVLILWDLNMIPIYETLVTSPISGLKVLRKSVLSDRGVELKRLRLSKQISSS